MLSFGTKADTLALLKNKVHKFKILPQITFTVDEFNRESKRLESLVMEQFSDNMLAVRSSALSEDTSTESNAGKYLSLLNVAPQNILEAAKKVANAFNDKKQGNQILIQPLLTDITMSGVLFTIDPNTGGHYFVINYDETGSSDSVTSGQGKMLVTRYVFRDAVCNDSRIEELISASKELMTLFESDSIDIEFAFTDTGQLYLLQARPLVLTHPKADYAMQKSALGLANAFLYREMSPKPYTKGKRSIYGVMPDWNPAEMIGIRPKPLASSLYRRLITNGIWAYQRDNYGYKNLRSVPLMADLCGLPYIDTRASFNSFIPKDISDDLSAKLVDYYLDCLEVQPFKHDKVEFDILFSCYTFDLPEKATILEANGFSSLERTELENALRRLTNNIINTTNGLWISDSERIERLKTLHSTVMNSEMHTVSKIYWLLENCARYGTLPFAGLARAGFVAVQLLNSLVQIGILSDDDYQCYMNELNTVSKQMTEDRQNLSRSAFLQKYGHLRPGTYDITSKRYDTAPELYFGETFTQEMHGTRNPFVLSLQQYSTIQEEMTKHGIGGDVLALFKFIRAGIEGREYAKFVFTRSLSDALELLAELGAQHGFTREEMSFFDIFEVDKFYSSADDIKSEIDRSIQHGRKKYEVALTFTMPPVILKPNDIYDFIMPTGMPNYITTGEVLGDVCIDCTNRQGLMGKILMIPAADPGYDWIFTCGISGFITAYGGVNSHMAIRAGELGIPAVIGAGEMLYSQWSKATTLHVDCANKRVGILR